MQSRERLDRLAEALLKEESVGEAQLRKLLGARPEAPTSTAPPTRALARSRSASRISPGAPT